VPPEDVWPWIVQMGQGRGGFYTYDWLENLFGCDLHNADRIVDEWQDAAVGDPFRLHPDVAMTVAEVTPPTAFVVRGSAPGAEDQPAPPYDFTWAFVLRPTAAGSRLLVRERYAYRAPAAALLIEAVATVSFVMSRKMLHGIKRRAERP